MKDPAGKVVGAATIARDVSDEQQANERLRSASLYARSLIEASLDPLVTISPEGKITDVNEATEQVTGVARAQLIGTDFSDYFTEPERAREGYRRVFHEGFVRDYPLAIRNVSGAVTDVLYNATVYRNDASEVVGVFAVARDVTERKRAEESLRTSERRLELALMMGHIGAFEVDLETGHGEWSPELNEIWGIPAGFEGDFQAFCWDHVHPDDLARVQGDFALAAQTPKPHEMDFRIIRPDGETRWVRWQGQVVNGSGTGSPRAIGVNMDITEKKLADERLSAAAREWRTTFDAMSDSVALFDAEGRVVRCNAATPGSPARSYDEIIGQRLLRGLPRHRMRGMPACPQSGRGETWADRDQQSSSRTAAGCASPSSRYDRRRRSRSPAACTWSATSPSSSAPSSRLHESLAQLQSVTDEVIAAIAGIVEVRDPYTAGHERRVSELATAIAPADGARRGRREGIRVAGLLHDVGKITVPAEILTKPAASRRSSSSSSRRIRR